MLHRKSTVVGGWLPTGFVVAATLFAGMMSTASAAIITDWDFKLEAGFIEFAPVPGVTGSNNNAYLSSVNSSIPTTTGVADFATIGAVPSRLSWGMPFTGAGPSSLGVGGTNGHYAGSAVTDGNPVGTIAVTHNNNRILGTSLTSATLFYHLFLDPELPAPPAVAGPIDEFALPALVLQISFLETPNFEACPVPSATLCNDVFVFEAPAGFNPADGSFNEDFLFGGEAYNAKLLLSGLSTLPDGACTAVGVSTGCIGFTTVENQSNVFQASLQITSTPFPAPEPGPLGAFGLGLAALAMLRRKPSAR